jgi:hypothetical protein
MNLSCAICTQDAGTSLVCPPCFKFIKPGTYDRLMKVWHKIIIDGANNTCEYCGTSHEADSGELAGDHIQTKGSRPDLVFDVTNGKCTCLPCHNKRHDGNISPTRVVKRTKPDRKLCSKCRLHLAGNGDKCPFCS